MSIEVLKSGRHRAVIMVDGRRHRRTFDTRAQAEQWEKRARRDIHLGLLDSPGMPQAAPEPERPARPMFADYAAGWVAHRDLKPSTRTRYEGMLDVHLAPKFGALPVDRITPDLVAAWHRELLPGRPTMRAHVYALLRAVMNSAVAEDLLPSNPCRVRGAGQAKRASVTELPTVEQVDALIAAMPGPKYQTMAALAAWAGLRFGELTELRRRDVILDRTGTPITIRVRRAVYLGVVDTPKSAAGVRDIVIPPHVRPRVQEYLAGRPKAPDALLFPGTRSGAHMKPSSLYKAFYAAREAAGVPSLRWHDLRHFSATTAAMTGASLAELQRRLGHSTVNAAMRYQHAAQSRDAEIAEAMSALAGAKVGNVIPIRPGSAEVVQEQQQEVKPVQSKPEQYWSLTETRRMLRLSNAGPLRVPVSKINLHGAPPVNVD